MIISATWEQLTLQEAVTITNRSRAISSSMNHLSLSKAKNHRRSALRHDKVTPLVLVALGSPPTLLVRTTNTARMSRDHVATRGDPDHDRGGCLLTTPETCLVSLESSSPRARHHSLTHIQGSCIVCVDPCDLRHSLVCPEVFLHVFYLKARIDALGRGLLGSSSISQAGLHLAD